MKTLVDRDNLVFNPPELGCVLSLSGLPGGGNKVYDRSPHGSIGSMTGAIWKRLPSGLWCLSFDGNDDYVNCGHNGLLNLTDALSAELWFRAASFTQFDTLIGRTLSGNWNDGGWAIFHDGGSSLRFWVDHYTNNVAHISLSVVDTDWHYVVGTYSKAANAIKIYLDAVKGTDDTYSSSITYDSADLTVGADTQHSYVFDGKIALVRIYNRALSALEIQNHFNREKHLFGVW